MNSLDTAAWGRTAGFTIIELIVVITIIGILMTLSVVKPIGALATSRDSERADDVASIARRLEQDYTEQTVGSPEYPYACQFVADAASVSGTASGLTLASYSAPGTSTSSVDATTACGSVTAGSTTPALNQYVYQPIDTSGAVCTTVAQTCIKFFLYYKMESNGTIVTMRSMHQQ